jgi:DNA-3-methyladenine glycosylase II
MPDYLHQVPAIRKGLKTLLAEDPVFSKLTINLNHFNWSYVGPGFEGLARIVVGQQVSTAAARSIWLKVSNAVTLTPQGFLKASEEELRALGLSRAKVATIKGLAEAARTGAFDPDAMQEMSNAQVSATITAMKGFGPWSAQMYLMFGLARPDIWAPGDLGIQIGYQYYMRAKQRPDHNKTARAEKKFIPHQTAACLLLWHLKAVVEAEKRAT